MNSDYFRFPFTEKLSFRTGWQNKKVSIQEGKRFVTRVRAKDVRDKILKEIKKAELDSAVDSVSIPNRFRIIPEKNNDRQTESKLEFPTYYLGLSRLYPIGEASEVSVNRNNFSENQMDYFRKNYTKIFDSFDDMENLSSISVSDSSKKHGLGLENSLYGPIGNSNGQDNLNQIIAAFASFRELKKTQGDNFIGGMLLIDELDASLHPAAQNKLIDFIISESRKIGIQVVFTSHSLSLLKHFIAKQGAQAKNVQDIELQYLTKGRGKVEVKKNPKYQWIENELLTSSGQRKTTPKIPIITEDDSASWLIEELLDYYELSDLRLDFLNLSSGWENIVNLIKYDFQYFGKYITILDADVSEAHLIKKIRGSQFSFMSEIDNDKITDASLLKFPNLLPKKCDLEDPKDFRPYVELEIWEYLKNLDADEAFYSDDYIESLPLFKRTVLNEGPDQNYKKGNFESKVKAWFKDNRNIIEHAVPFFIDAHSSQVKKFINSIIAKYNYLVQENYSQLKQIALLQE